MGDAAVPWPVQRLLELAALDWLARLALASPFFVSGFIKLLDFPGAATEVGALGIRPAGPFVVAVILRSSPAPRCS
jgi:uncharacterized membrane protein YphA (DoxX/SURF4 family)